MALQLQRTANAGVLMNLDGVSILLDGVCGQIAPYLPTPEAIRRRLQREYPDIVAFTHAHGDHYDHAFATAYQEQTLRPVFGPEVLPCGGREGEAVVKGVKITAVSSRHIGKFTDPHVSFLLQGSQCIWFVGDASPLQWQRRTDLPKPDVLIAPFAYATTASAWQTSCRMAEKIVLLHLPNPAEDPSGLWSMVQQATVNCPPGKLYIPEMGSVLIL